MQALDLDVLQQWLAWRREGRRAWLVTVAKTFGASPRPPGSLLAMRDDGIVAGSVSGGCIEDDLVERREEFHGRKPHFVTYGVSGDEARRFGLPCGGSMEVIIECEVDTRDVEALLARIGAGEMIARHVDLSSGAWSLAHGEPMQACMRNAREFVSLHGPRWRMLLIGASDIARYIAEMAAPLDFKVFVCDPREEFRTAWRVDGSAWIEGMPDEAVLTFRPDVHSVVLAVSHDLKLDDMALLEALGSDAFYVGAVGSQKTSAARRARLADFDLTAAQTARLHGPAGLALGSRTPPEIAVAILAGLVAARNGVRLEKVVEQQQSSLRMAL